MCCTLYDTIKIIDVNIQNVVSNVQFVHSGKSVHFCTFACLLWVEHNKMCWYVQVERIYTKVYLQQPYVELLDGK